MWLITTRGFYSVVADHYEDGNVLVRARVREDLEALGDLIPGLEVEETPERDYRFRASVPREVWTATAGALAEEIDYPNFKNAVAERQGPERAGTYGRVWWTLLDLQED
jgi:hypothetical protein